MNQVWVVVSDLHMPFHDKVAYAKVCKLVHDIKPYGVVVNGDCVDLFSLGSYNADSLEKLREVTLSWEYAESSKAIRMLEDALPKGAEKHFIEGNHEDRFWREKERGDTAKYGTAFLEPAVGLGLVDRGWKTHGRWLQAQVRLGGHLEVWHGNYTLINVSKKAAEEARGGVIVGHSHRMSTFVEGKFAGWNFGFLGDMQSPYFDYMSRNKKLRWTQSFGVVNITPKGYHYVEPIQIFQKSFVYGGRMY